MKKLRKITAAAVTCGALLATGTVTAVAAPAQIVDTENEGVIYLTKYDDAAGLSTPTGAQQAVGEEANELEGIEFTLQQIEGVNFSTNDGLAAAAALTPATAAAGELGEPIVKTTDAAGQITFDGLDVGAYLLTETDSVAEDGTVYRAAAPSIVFVPTTDPTNEDKWLTNADGDYAVWVYPKNSEDSNVKSVVDLDQQAGEMVTFSVDATIPASSEGNELQYFGFFDEVDPALSITGADANVTLKAGDTELVNGQDFQYWVDGQKLTVAATEAGLAKIAAAKAADSTATAVMTFDAKVNYAAVVPNQAVVYKNTGEAQFELVPPAPGTPPEPGNPPEEPPTPPTPTPNDPFVETNTTVSAWGRISINKTDEAGEPLTGAEFQIYRCADGVIADDAQPIAAVSTAADADNTAAAANSTVFSDVNNDGLIVVDGLHVNDVADDKDNAQPGYCLVETKAPDGYELRHEPIPFELELGGRTAVTTVLEYDENGQLVSESTSEKLETFLAEDAPLNLVEAVVNIPVKPKLPLTGGAGIAVFGLLGAAVIGGGLYAAKRNAGQAA